MASDGKLTEQQRGTLDRLKPLADTFGVYLAGGTAVAAHLGHRVSRDVDLFSRSAALDLEQVRRTFADLPEAEVTSITDAALRGRIGGVPVDIVRYPYALLKPTEEGPGRFPTASLEDLAVMKLAAVARRGIRRDFWDLHEIFQGSSLTLEQVLEAYVRRYGVKESDLYHVLRSLTYFSDAEADTIPPEGMTVEKWAEIKEWFLANVPLVLGKRLVVT